MYSKFHLRMPNYSERAVQQQNFGESENEKKTLQIQKNKKSLHNIIPSYKFTYQTQIILTCHIQTVEMDDDDVSEEIEIIEYDENVDVIDRIVIQTYNI